VSWSVGGVFVDFSRFFSPKEKWHLKFSCKYIFIFLKKNKLGGWGMESAHTVA
jgi:hypothetical protein